MPQIIENQAVMTRTDSQIETLKTLLAETNDLRIRATIEKQNPEYIKYLQAKQDAQRIELININRDKKIDLCEEYFLTSEKRKAIENCTAMQDATYTEKVTELNGLHFLLIDIAEQINKL